MTTLRKFSQALFLLIFLFLFIQTESKGDDTLGYPVRIFLDFDPLIFITTIFSTHAVSKAFFLSLLLVLLTAVMGRVFCGWVCPMGTLNNMTGALRKGGASSDERGLHKIKYFLLLFLAAGAVFGVQLAGIFDPLSLLIRSLSTSVNPAFNYAVRAVFDTLYGLDVRAVSAVSEPVYAFLKKYVLSFQPSFYAQGLFIGLLFISVLVLNLVEKRFWCRYLCPLGALLGLLSRFSLLRRSVSEGCTSCGACSRVCQAAASPDKPGSWRGTECWYCMNCDDVCPHNAVSFGFGRKRTASFDLGRRNVVFSLMTGVAAVPLVRQTPVSKTGCVNPELIRPPGALEEKEFLKRCVKCGECMKVCTTNGLQPTLFEAGAEGIWSPVLVPKLGWCEYRCTLCGQVCPTGAIKKLSIAEKAEVGIGLAVIDRGRCLPHAHATPCIVCEEVCPTPKKAIWLEKTAVRDRNGKIVELQLPKVDAELCIGCGICENKCPVASRPAIYVISTGESRSKENRLLI